MSVSYEVFQKAQNVQIDDFETLSDEERNAWLCVDAHYLKKKQLVNKSKTYDEFKKNRKEIKNFEDLPDGVKRTWLSIDKNYEKLIKLQSTSTDESPKEELKEVVKKQKAVAKKEKVVDEEAKKEKEVKKKTQTLAQKMEALKKLKSGL